MMPGSGFKVVRVMGIPIYVHPSWFIIFLLITATLATQFTAQHPQWHTSQQWTMGLLTSLLFFASVLTHELGHSMIALRYKIPVASITLFVFGGLARITREPDRPLQEFNIAIAGPVTSFLLAGLFYAIARLFAADSVVAATASWLAVINALLAGFNLVPGFPLDGGRVLRSIAWAWTKNFNRATQLASRSGQFIAYLLIFSGIGLAVVSGRWLDGLWWVFIGWFLLSAAQESYAQVAMREVLGGLHASDLMSVELPTIDRSLSLEDYFHEVLRTGRRCHLVLGNGQLAGMITLHNVRLVPRGEWATTSVQAAMLPRERVEWAQANEPALGILERMQASDINQMPVLDDGRVVGMVSREAMLRVIQTRLQAERLAHS
ncbi:MAG TPA: site-2 protease family protein [Candidatus Acidoferrales bacterium]|nr:site-2 protease family protein [Candidatus Acidoferrales bacterium]